MAGQARIVTVSPDTVITLRNDARSVCSPTNAATVVDFRQPGDSASTYVIVSGTTGADASIAAWNMAGRNAPVVRPHQVVPSGKTATTAPSRSAVATSRTVSGKRRGKDRST